MPSPRYTCYTSYTLAWYLDVRLSYLVITPGDESEWRSRPAGTRARRRAAHQGARLLPL